jgi:hypothetical protein
MDSGFASKGLSRRRFFLSLAGTGLAGGVLMQNALKAALQDAVDTTVGAPSPEGMPLVRAAFLRPRGDYWLGWPGTAWDVDGATKRFTELLATFGHELGVRVEAAPAPLYDDEGVNAFIHDVKEEKPRGVVVFPLHMDRWAQVARIARSGIRTIVFAPLGTAFTGHLQTVRKLPNVYLASSGDFDLNPVRFGLKMIRTAYEIERTKIAVLRGTETKESTLKGLGMKLRYLPRQRFADAFHAMDNTPAIAAMAEECARNARKVVEPTKRDLLNAAKNYFVALQIMEDEGCQGITMDCLGLVSEHKIPTPPCLAWARLLDRGVTATCEADINAVMSHVLTCALLDKPGFQQDPVPDTFNNTLIGAHCVCATRLSGYDKSPEPYTLRSHSESDLGVSVQVHWPIGQDVTIMQFVGPEKMILGKGKVVANHETPPAGGCRTSVELEIDGPEETADTKGFHQLFIFGNHVRDFRAYARLNGIAVEHI